MNKLTGIINKIQVSGAVMLVDVYVDGQSFSALLIESANQASWLCEGNEVYIVFKETEVSLAKGLTGMISLRNRMKCTVLGVVRGELLSSVSLRFGQYKIASAVTTRAIDSLMIATGDEIEALVKANEISLMKIVDE